ncbi:hypothetical protein DC3_46210 [Deinococcus cellulosilyticus NBRC 106333 = KACC 11606]|uniref:Uncharacterized protein n=1 Tax=Deinococcus cellulosilyticus (strain DSM 18568 / NBRC 106333 / KACC 11606 / 5516J-15) TaxID=1223518 RepID=A0A511N923_DEIC1|nr:hypothetical protein DC3_46210 [Deinococcus cellulosilyticus NBRC 106333 = KACC 11606]
MICQIIPERANGPDAATDSPDAATNSPDAAAQLPDLMVRVGKFYGVWI